MTDSTKRALRTGVQLLLAALVVVPILAGALQGTGVGVLVQVAGWLVLAATTVSKAVNALEDAGMFPAWLKAPKPDADGDAGHARLSALLLGGGLTLAILALPLAASLQSTASADPGVHAPSTHSWAAGDPDSKSWADIRH